MKQNNGFTIMLLIFISIIVIQMHGNNYLTIGCGILGLIALFKVKIKKQDGTK